MATITLTVTVDTTVTDELGHSFTFGADRALDVLTQALQISAARNSSGAEGAMDYDDGSSYDLALALVQNAAIATSMRVDLPAARARTDVPLRIDERDAPVFDLQEGVGLDAVCHGQPHLARVDEVGGPQDRKVMRCRESRDLECGRGDETERSLSGGVDMT
ncbi:MAG: hypothetical protein FJW64_01545 [Actinobacteria bacterium]|nr:hypothetical protein [Actinomycetota bacterium]